jgi:hypothetical protein
VKSRGLTSELPFELHIWSFGGECGIPNVEVKFVDIRRNTGGEGGTLDKY